MFHSYFAYVHFYLLGVGARHVCVQSQEVDTNAQCVRVCVCLSVRGCACACQ